MPGRRDTRPRHAQIAAELREAIMSGELSAGAQLPSTAQLMERYSAASNTIQNAIGVLRDEGYIRSAAGRGVFVRERQPLVVRMSSYFEPIPGGYTYELLDVAESVPPARVAAWLDLGPEDTAVLRHRLMRHDGEPIELSWSWYPSDIAHGTALAEWRKIRGGAPAVLAELGYPQRAFTDRIAARLPTTEEVIGLDLPEDLPVIQQWRVVHCDERAVEVSKLV